MEEEQTPAYKLRIAVIFRADLTEMTRAKSEVQFGHAVAGLIYNGLISTHHSIIPEYMMDGQTKLSMEVPSLDDIMKIMEKAKKRNVPYYLVTDAAHTIFSEPTITCIGLGPMNKTDTNALTRNAAMRDR